MPIVLDPAAGIALIVAITGLIGAVTTLIVAVRGYQAHVNSRMDQLLDLTKTTAHAQGVVEGIAAPKGPAL